MSKSSELQSPTSNVTSPESSVSSSHSLPQRAFYRYTRFYEKSNSHKGRQSTVRKTATSEHSGSTSSKSNLLPQKKVESTKLLSCFRPGCLRRQMSSRSFRCQSKQIVADGDEDAHKYSDKNSPDLKMEVLKREVNQLENQLVHEQVMHEALKYAHQYDPNHSISVPSYLPPKVKELLMEMREVTDEITRLERQISELRIDMTLEKEKTKGLKSRNTQEGKKRYTVSKSIVKFGNIRRIGSEKMKNKCDEFQDRREREITVPMLDLGLNLKYN